MFSDTFSTDTHWCENYLAATSYSENGEYRLETCFHGREYQLETFFTLRYKLKTIFTCRQGLSIDVNFYINCLHFLPLQEIEAGKKKDL